MVLSRLSLLVTLIEGSMYTITSRYMRLYRELCPNGGIVDTEDVSSVSDRLSLFPDAEMTCVYH